MPDLIDPRAVAAQELEHEITKLAPLERHLRPWERDLTSGHVKRGERELRHYVRRRYLLLARPGTWDATGSVAQVVEASPDCWRVYGPGIDGWELLPESTTLEQAQAHVDERLRAAGYLLEAPPLDCAAALVRAQDAEQELRRLRDEVELLRRERDGEVWLWQGDEGDDVDSLACPVLIHPQDVRKLHADAALGALLRPLVAQAVGELPQLVHALLEQLPLAVDALLLQLRTHRDEHTEPVEGCTACDVLERISDGV